LLICDVDRSGEALREMIEAMTEVREAGFIREVGLIVSGTEILKRAVSYGQIDAVLVPYSIFNRPADADFLSFCRMSGIAVHACEPLCRGLLSGALHSNSVFAEGDIRINDQRFRGQRFRDNIETAERLRHFAAQEGYTLLELALGWVLQHPSISSVICGAKTTHQLRQLISAMPVNLNLDQILEIELIVGDRKHQRAVE
jgi:aryl-alcohol dehydrogenase-like predicted oxidoreductase